MPLGLHRAVGVLQEREFDRLGTPAACTSICAVSQPPTGRCRMVRRGKFRADLYPLNVIALRLPPLRERGKTSANWRTFAAVFPARQELAG